MKIMKSLKAYIKENEEKTNEDKSYTINMKYMETHLDAELGPYFKKMSFMNKIKAVIEGGKILSKWQDKYSRKYGKRPRIGDNIEIDVSEYKELINSITSEFKKYM